MNNMSRETVEKVAEEVALEVYKDALQPSVKPIGEVLGFIPRTIRLWLSGWEKWLMNGEASVRMTAEAIEEKIKQIPEDKVVEPEAYVAVPAIQQLAYCQNNPDLRELYANLLVSSMNADKKWQVHPAFVDIIKQLSPDEARMINAVPNMKNYFLPLIDVKATSKYKVGNNTGGHQLIVTNFTTFGFDVIENKENICNYVDNLVRLKLFDIPPTYHLTEKSRYDSLEADPVLNRMIDPFRSVFDIGFNHKLLVISHFGLAFKQCCCSK